MQRSSAFPLSLLNILQRRTFFIYFPSFLFYSLSLDIDEYSTLCEQLSVPVTLSKLQIHGTTAFTAPRLHGTTAFTAPRPSRHHGLYGTTAFTAPRLHGTTAFTAPRPSRHYGLYSTTALLRRYEPHSLDCITAPVAPTEEPRQPHTGCSIATWRATARSLHTSQP